MSRSEDSIGDCPHSFSSISLSTILGARLRCSSSSSRTGLGGRRHFGARRLGKRANPGTLIDTLPRIIDPRRTVCISCFSTPQLGFSFLKTRVGRLANRGYPSGCKPNYHAKVISLSITVVTQLDFAYDLERYRATRRLALTIPVGKHFGCKYLDRTWSQRGKRNLHKVLSCGG